MHNKNNSATFYNLGIAPRLLEIIASLKFTIPTPIQERAIPAAIEGKDLIGIAQTGTGKTLAFGIPMIQRIAQVEALRRNPHIIIGTPGRIIDHLEQKTLSLDGVSVLVLDEADRMLDMGFAP